MSRAGAIDRLTISRKGFWMKRFLLVTMLLLATSQLKADHINNGGFETGDFTGWTYKSNGNFSFTGVGSPNDFFANVWGQTIQTHSGNYYAYLGDEGVPLSTLSQVVHATPGQYVLNMYLTSDGLTTWQDGSDTPNVTEFKVVWDGHVLYDQQDLIMPALDADDNSLWSLLSFPVHVTGTDYLYIGERDDAGWLFLDDVSLDPVPEPSSLSLWIVGIGCLAWRKLR